MSRPLSVLVADDEKNIRSTLRLCLASLGCAVTEAADAAAAIQATRSAPLELAFVDLRLGKDDGLALLPQLLAERPGLSIVVITAYAAVDTAVEAIRRGAVDYLPKPFSPAQIKHAVEKVVRTRTDRERLAQLQGDLARSQPEPILQTRSPRMQAVIEQLQAASGHDVPVLLRGENGTGKGVLARALHAFGPRRDRPFVVVNCPTLSAELLASELFGHARGSFTGAVRDQPGRVEAAEGGTLFLDEIAELPPALQAKLLRFLQERQFERVGEVRTRTADVRVVAATNRELEKEVAEGRFREDLLYRLNVLELTVPPLRDRREDLPELARALVSFAAQSFGRSAPSIGEEALAALAGYPWPGNVRELKNVLERALILGKGPELLAAHLPERFAGGLGGVPDAPPQPGADCTLEELERAHVKGVLARASTQEEAARILGIDASTLWRKRKKLEGG